MSNRALLTVSATGITAYLKNGGTLEKAARKQLGDEMADRLSAPDEAVALSQMADAFLRTLAAREEEQRRQRLAAFYAKPPKSEPR